MLLAAITHAHDQLSKIGRHSPMRNQKLHRTTESFLDGIDIVGVDPRNERCLRLIGIFSQIFTTYVWNYSAYVYSKVPNLYL